jgi:short-subunit dehydrogenase
MARTILIVGNSDGIGAAVTKKLTERGDRVIGISRSASPLGPEGPRHEVADVTSPQYADLLRRLILEETQLAVCIYCAGVGSELELPDLSGEARVIDINLTAMIRTIEILVPHWLTRGGGHFVGLSSLADDIYSPDAPSYSASKAGFSNYVLSLGLKLRRQHIYMTNIRFGFVDTKMAKSPFRPMMMSSERAAIYIVDCLEKRPLQLSVPKIVGALAHLVRWNQSVRIWMT